MTTFDKTFDQMLDTLFKPIGWDLTSKTAPTYPPYNLIEISKTEHILEIAVAGFKEDELKVSHENNMLKVVGQKSEEDVAKYLYKGIGTRKFLRTFNLSDDAIVKGADYSDGILSIQIEYKQRENAEKIIPIGKQERIYLTERDDIVS